MSVKTVTGPAALAGQDLGTGLNRRRFLGVAGAASAAALAIGPAASPGSLTADERLMILQVARAGAVFPIEFPGFGEPGPAAARATAGRLLRAASRTSPGRLSLARAGADALIADGLLNRSRARLLDGIGQQAGTAGAEHGLTAAVALAIATVSRHFEPGSDDAALVWTDGLRRLHERGALAGRDA
jgi:hypothetical protein